MPVTTFANNPSTTVAVNGYESGAATGDAPAALTAEVWTMTSSTEFTVANSSAVPATQFHIADEAAPTELITVTLMNGTSNNTWAVTRGAEGTTPVTHAAGATFYQVVTAGDLQNFKQVPSTLYSPTTVTSTTETVLASYSVPAADFQTGATFEIVAFGPWNTGGTSTKSIFQFALYWGGSGAVGSAFVATGSTKLAWIKSGTNTAALTNTTIVAGNSWDLNASITLLSGTTAAANMNVWYTQTITVIGISATTTNTNASGLSEASAVGTISGSSGPIILTGYWPTASASSLTAVAPVIYRSA